MKIISGAIVAGLLVLSAKAQQQQPTQPQPANPGGNSSSQQLPPGLQNRQQLPPGLNQRETLPPGLAGRSQGEGDVNQSQNQNPANQPEYGTNNWGQIGSNLWHRFGTNLSRFGTNAYNGLSNAWTTLSNRFSTNGYPTGNRGNENRSYYTNSLGGTNRVSLMQDRAYTAADQHLLVQIRQTIRPIFNTANRNEAWMPVHFICRDRVVQVVGYVPTQEQKKRIVTLVQEVPGVVRVVDQLQVNAQVNGGLSGYSQSGGYSGGTIQPQPDVRFEDQAVTSFDQHLLTTIHQEIRPVFQTSGAQAPVHFYLRQGVVTLVGVVPTEQERQQIYQIVQRTPGVVQVVNQIQVNAQANVNTGGSSEFAGGTNQMQAQSTNSLFLGSTNQLQLTNSAAGAGLSTNFFGNAGTATNSFGSNTNLSPTGRTNANNRVYPNDRGQEQNQNQNLPPGLQKRETLPPGLQNRNELPPGLQKRGQ